MIAHLCALATCCVIIKLRARIAERYYVQVENEQHRQCIMYHCAKCAAMAGARRNHWPGDAQRCSTCSHKQHTTPKATKNQEEEEEENTNPAK